MEVGETHEVDLARVGDDQLGAVAHRALDVEGADRVRLGRVRADHEDGVGREDVDEGVGHGAAAQRLREAGDGRGVAEPGAVVDVVRADHGAHELLEEVVLLVRAARRGKAGQGVGAVLVADGDEALGHKAERLVPRGRLQLAGATHERCR